jgi:prepilin-type processing-associated H-X9-DG protein
MATHDALESPAGAVRERDPVAIPYATPGPKVVPSIRGVAAASLTCALAGIAGTCLLLQLGGAHPTLLFGLGLCAVLATLGAVLLGFHAIRRAPGPAEGKGLAVVGLTLGGLWCAVRFNAAIMMPRMGRAREPANRIKCASNLRQIGYGIALYANENNGLCPPDLATVLNTQDLTSEVFVCPSTDHERAVAPTTAPWRMADLPAGKHLSYVYLGAGQNLNKLPAKWVMAYDLSTKHHSRTREAPRDRGVNVLFADGAVDYVPNAQPIIDQLKAGQNPPKGLP